MAEVLITLGVIGVVAALTMPSLIAHYQKKVLVTQIKKAYSTLNEGFRQIMAQEGCTDLICAGFMDSSYHMILNESNINKLVSTFKLSDFSNTSNIFNYDIKSLNGNVITADLLDDLNTVGAYSGKTPDGMFVSFVSDNSVNQLILFDVNGKKGPNVAGRDIFYITVTNNIITPYFSLPYLKFVGLDLDGDLINQESITKIVKDGCSQTGSGRDPSQPLIYCLERIIIDGWEMKY